MNVAYYIDFHPLSEKTAMHVLSIKTQASSKIASETVLPLIAGRAYELSSEQVSILKQTFGNQRKKSEWVIGYVKKVVDSINLYYGELERILEITAGQTDKSTIKANLNSKSVITAEKGVVI